jgi:hypothetical protein
MRYHRPSQLGDIDLDADDHFKNPYPEGFSKVEVPEGTSGDWSVQRFEVTRRKASLFNLRLIRDGQRRRVVPLGWYTRLVRGHQVVMSDTPAEAHENFQAYSKARGRVLINGLGLGFVLKAILTKRDVVVTVVEKSEDVIRLVGPSFRDDPRVEIICADALTWRPARGERFDVAWHDIWDDICEDNKSDMRALRRAYARKTDWQGCWSAEYL